MVVGRSALPLMSVILRTKFIASYFEHNLGQSINSLTTIRCQPDARHKSLPIHD